MVSRYQSGDSLREVREKARVHLVTCIPKQGECGCSLDLIPQSPRFIVKRAGSDTEISAADYIASQQDYRRQRDATGTSPEAVENVARWAARALTDAQFEAEYVAIYGPVSADRALFNATRTRFRAAQG